MGLILAVCVLSANPADPLSAAQLREEVHRSLCRWSPVTPQNIEPAGRHWVGLYHRVAKHPTLAHSSRQELTGKLRRRLAEVSRIANVRRRYDAATPPVPAATAPATVALPEHREGVLAQVGPGRAGPSSAVASTGDAGPELVDLIQQTIAPATWSARGGPGVIMYWSTGRAMVVHQTADVHDQVADLLAQLR